MKISTGAAILFPLLPFSSLALQATPVDPHSRALVQVNRGGHFVPSIVLLIPCAAGHPGGPSLARAHSGPSGDYFDPSLALLIACAANRPVYLYSCALVQVHRGGHFVPPLALFITIIWILFFEKSLAMQIQ